MNKNQDRNQQLILNYIEAYRKERNTSPTLREIEAGTKIPRSTVSRHLARLKEQGALSFGGHRSIVLKEQRAATVRVPILGSVSCGVPKYAEANIEEYAELPVSLFGEGEYFMLYANGDSMINAGINHGDPVLIHRQSYAEPGQIVVALMEEEANLKRYYPEPEHHRVRLHAENPAYPDMYTEQCRIQGVAVKVIKSLL